MSWILWLEEIYKDNSPADNVEFYDAMGCIDIIYQKRKTDFAQDEKLK